MVISEPNRILVTGCSGLLDSDVCYFYASLGTEVPGLHNHARGQYFRPLANTAPITTQMIADLKTFIYHDIDLCNAKALHQLFRNYPFDVVVYCCSQHSH